MPVKEEREMVVKHWREVEEVEPQESGAVGVRMRVLIGDEEGAPNFIMRYFTVEPGGNTPRHSHPWEHEVFVISGHGEVVQGDERLAVGPGSVVYVAPGEEHQFVNTGKDALVFLCIIPRSTI
jgi:quercetin dioxygenase-like cupin family protein